MLITVHGSNVLFAIVQILELIVAQVASKRFFDMRTLEVSVQMGSVWEIHSACGAFEQRTLNILSSLI